MLNDTNQKLVDEYMDKLSDAINSLPWIKKVAIYCIIEDDEFWQEMSSVVTWFTYKEKQEHASCVAIMWFLEEQGWKLDS